MNLILFFILYQVYISYLDYYMKYPFRNGIPALAVTFITAFPAVSAQANLIVNGGFETGDSSGWSVTLVGSSTATVISSSPPYYSAYEGTKQIALSTSRGTFGSNIYQDISTTAGSNYEISFAVRPSGSFGSTFGVSIDGSQLGSWQGSDAIFANSSVPPVLDYHPFSLSFNAVNAVTRVSFGWVDNQASWYLDKVAVTASASSVPLPAAFWLLGSGITGLICMARRKSAL